MALCWRTKRLERFGSVIEEIREEAPLLRGERPVPELPRRRFPVDEGIAGAVDRAPTDRRQDLVLEDARINRALRQVRLRGAVEHSLRLPLGLLEGGDRLRRA